MDFAYHSEECVRVSVSSNPYLALLTRPIPFERLNTRRNRVALGRGLTLWLAFLWIIPYNHDPWRLTGLVIAGWVLILSILLLEGRKLLAGPGLWFCFVLTGWFALATPVDDVERARCFAQAVAAGLAVTCLPRAVAAAIPRRLLLSGSIALAISFIDGTLNQGLGFLQPWRPIRYMEMENTLFRWTGVFQHPNIFALAIVVTVACAFACRWPADRRGPLLALMLGIVAGWCMFMTYSRTGQVMLALTLLGGMALAWPRRSRRRPLAPLLALCLGVLVSFTLGAALHWDKLARRYVAATTDMQPTHDWRLFGANDDPTLAPDQYARAIDPDAVDGPIAGTGRQAIAISRVDMARDALNLWQRRFWTGWGLGGYFRHGLSSYHHAHNLPLEIAVSGGLIGLLLFFLPIALALLAGNSPLIRGFILVTLLSGFIDCYFVYRWPAVMLALFVGLALRGISPRLLRAGSRLKRASVRTDPPLHIPD